MHAGNEFNQQQWRHAKPYVQIAEDQLGEAEQAAARCLPATPVATAPLTPQAPVAAPPETTIALNGNVLFNFDRHERDQIRRASLASLAVMAARSAAGEVEVQSVKLAGHADRLNSTGDNADNKRVAERRVLTVRNDLVERGVPAHLITVGEFGDSQQVTACDKERLSQAALQECLLPNRRVEVVLTAKTSARSK